MHTVVHLHLLGASDQPAWCEACCLPSAVDFHYVLTAAHTVPAAVHTVTVCDDCGWQDHG